MNRFAQLLALSATFILFALPADIQAQCTGLCPGDADGDGVADIGDLLDVIQAWGPCPAPCPTTPCPADTAPTGGNCVVDADDLLAVIVGWGPCPAPANDNCAQPIFATIPLGAVFASYPFCTEYATTDGSPEAGCGFCCSDPQIHKDIWYFFNSANFSFWNDIFLHVDTCGSDFDTKVALYAAGVQGNCQCPVPVAPLVCNDDASLSGCGLQSRIRHRLAPNTCYLIRVGGYNGQSGNGVMRFGLFWNGDECFNAIDLGQVTSTHTLSAFGSTHPESQMEPGVGVPQAPCTSFPDGRDVWYKFLIGCSQPLGAVTTCHPETNFDTILTLYRGTCDGLLLVGCNDDYISPNCQINGLNRKSLIDLPNPPSPEYYYVRVSGYNGAVGSYRLTVGLSCIN